MQDSVYNAAFRGEDTKKELAMVHPQLIPDVLFHKSPCGYRRYTPLVVAASNGHTKAVSDLLHYQDKYCGGDLKLNSNTNIFEALFEAARINNLAVMKTILRTDDDANRVNCCGETILHKMCRRRTEVQPIAAFLLSRGANLDIADAKGETCLFNACREGHEDVVALFLAEGADPNHTSLSKATPLHAAAVGPKSGIARLLFQHGASVSRDGNGYTPLLLAALLGSPDCVEFFLTRPEFSRKEKIDALELLGAVFSSKSTEITFTYWKRAMEERYRDPADIILKPQCPPVADMGSVVESQTPQELESRQRDWHKLQLEAVLVVERILGEAHKQVAVICADICREHICMARYEEAFVVWKYGRKHSQLVEDLSRLDKYVRRIFHEGFHPTFIQYHDILHLTVQEMEVQARAAEQDREYFVFAYINVRECVSYIWRALCLASSDDDLSQLQDVTRRLIKVAPRFHPEPTMNLAVCFTERQLLHEFVDTDCSDSFFSLFRLLVECGADVSGKGKSGDTPLHFVCMAVWRLDDLEFVCSLTRLLLELGADVDARNAWNKTALDTTRHEYIRAVLLEHYPLSLKCLAASTIAQSRVSYQGLVPSAVESFIKIHESC